MATNSQTTPSKDKGLSNVNEENTNREEGAKGLGGELVKIFGTAELTQMDGSPTPPDKLQRLVDGVRATGIAGFRYNNEGQIIGGVIRYPLQDKQADVVL